MKTRRQERLKSTSRMTLKVFTICSGFLRKILQSKVPKKFKGSLFCLENAKKAEIDCFFSIFFSEKVAVQKCAPETYCRNLKQLARIKNNAFKILNCFFSGSVMCFQFLFLKEFPTSEITNNRFVIE